MALPDRCSHGKTWGDDCPECEAAWESQPFRRRIPPAVRRELEAILAEMSRNDQPRVRLIAARASLRHLLENDDG